MFQARFRNLMQKAEYSENVLYISMFSLFDGIQFLFFGKCIQGVFLWHSIAVGFVTNNTGVWLIGRTTMTMVNMWPSVAETTIRVLVLRLWYVIVLPLVVAMSAAYVALVVAQCAILWGMEFPFFLNMSLKIGFFFAIVINYGSLDATSYAFVSWVCFVQWPGQIEECLNVLGQTGAPHSRGPHTCAKNFYKVKVAY